MSGLDFVGLDFGPCPSSPFVEGKSLVVLYCRPFTCEVLALDVAAEHVATLEDRMSRGAFCPRTLWATRPELWRSATQIEVRLASASFQVHEWTVLSVTRIKAET